MSSNSTLFLQTVAWYKPTSMLRFSICGHDFVETATSSHEHETTLIFISSCLIIRT